METPTHRSMGAARLAALAVGIVVLAAVGAFGGHWLWAQYESQTQVRKAAAEREAAAAFRRTPEGMQRQAVLEYLNDPSSAVFRDVRQSRREPSTWCGQVNAKNRMGALVGFRRYVVVLEGNQQLIDEFVANAKGDRDAAYALLVGLHRVSIDPDDSQQPSARQASFEGQWSSFCG